MDADLQHPPSKLPELIEPLDRGEAEFVSGSRFTPGGSIAENWSMVRRFYSRFGKALARPFAGGTTDPMSGFFALSRSTYERAHRLTPLGYKIGLELICKSRVRQVCEVPIHFAERTQGRSKLTFTEQFKYLEHLSRLYDFTFPRASPVIKFMIVLASSGAFAFLLFIVLRSFDVSAMISGGLSYLVAIAVTAMFHARYIRTQREFMIRPTPWRDFILISAAELGIFVITAWWAMRIPEPTLVDIFFVPFVCATVVRYILRKEFLQDVRGLRKEPRAEEIA
jgi:dolichol-phosphate mannosyltransferase